MQLTNDQCVKNRNLEHTIGDGLYPGVLAVAGVFANEACSDGDRGS